MPVFFKLTCKADFEFKGYTDAAKLACSSSWKCYILWQKMFLIRNQFYLFICLFFWYTLRRTVMGRGLLASTFMLQELHKFIAFRNKTFLFVKIETWNLVRFHEILCSSLYMANIVLFYSFLIQVEIKKKYYWICSLRAGPEPMSLPFI